MSTRRLLWILAVVVVFALALAAQTAQPAASPTTVIKHVPIKNTSAASGQEMFSTYCAVCHGKDGKGNGPAADALKAAPSNLTTLSSKNGGKYPSMKVASIIRGDDAVPAHGSKEMPVWGKLFYSMSEGHEAEVLQRVANLNHYVESLQTK